MSAPGWRPSSRRSSAAAPIRPAPSRSRSTRPRRPSSRPNSTASMRKLKKAGCEGSSGFFSIFSNQPASCGPLNGQIQQMKGNLDRINGDLARLQGSDPAPEREGQRRALIGALSQNDCGPQYRQAAAQPQRSAATCSNHCSERAASSATRRCRARTRRRAPAIAPCACACATATIIRSRIRPARTNSPRTRRPAKPRAQPRRHSSSPIATRARTSIKPSHRAGNSTPPFPMPSGTGSRSTTPAPARAARLRLSRAGQDPTVQAGDVVVTEERAKQMSQPRVDAQGKPIKLETPTAARTKIDPKAAATPATPDAPETKADDAPVKVDARSEQDDPPGRPDLHRALASAAHARERGHPFRNRTRRSSPRRHA